MKVNRRTEILNIRVSKEFKQLLAKCVRFNKSESDIMHEALADYSRKLYFINDPKIHEVQWAVEETDNISIKRRKDVIRIKSKLRQIIIK